MTKTEICSVLDRQSEILAELGYTSASSKIDAISFRLSLTDDVNKIESIANMVFVTILGLINEYNDVLKDNNIKVLDIVIKKLSEVKDSGKILSLREILEKVHQQLK